MFHSEIKFCCPGVLSTVTSKAVCIHLYSSIQCMCRHHRWHHVCAFLYHTRHLTDFCFIPWSGPCLWILLVKMHWMSTRWASSPPTPPTFIRQLPKIKDTRSSVNMLANFFYFLFCLAFEWTLVAYIYLRDSNTLLGISSHM